MIELDILFFFLRQEYDICRRLNMGGWLFSG